MSSISNPKISVLLPCYNAEKYIKDSIDSILAQTYQNIEFIIIDDGSTDLSLSIIKSLAATDPRIQFFSRENRGLAKTLNQGIDIASGRYIARMDQDDIAHPERLQKQFAFMENNPHVGVCGTWAQTFGTKSRLLKMPVTNNEIKARLFFESPFVHPAVMIRKDVLHHFKLYYRVVVAEDYDLWSRASKFCEYHNLPEVLLDYRIHPTQITSTQTNGVENSAMLIRYAQAEELLNQSLTNGERDSMAALTLRSSNTSPIFDVFSFCFKLAKANRLQQQYDHNHFINELYKRLRNALRKSDKPARMLAIRFFLKNGRSLVREFGVFKTISLVVRGLL